MKRFAMLFSLLLCAGLAAAQQPKSPAPMGGPEGPGPQMRRGMGEQRMRTPGPGGMQMRGPFGGMPGKWWKNSELVQQVGLSDTQVQQMEKIFQDYRLKLIDQHAALQKEELQMEPLVESDSPDEAKVTAQIDRIANARASLEKSNALMMLGIRKVMTAEQWKKLQELTPPPPPTPPAPPAPGQGFKRRVPGGELEE
jgi:Spy/CpxP family protein refolding chaperone